MTGKNIEKKPKAWFNDILGAREMYNDESNDDGNAGKSNAETVGNADAGISDEYIADTTVVVDMTKKEANTGEPILADKARNNIYSNAGKSLNNDKKQHGGKDKHTIYLNAGQWKAVRMYAMENNTDLNEVVRRALYSFIPESYYPK